MEWKTKVTELLDCKYPILQGTMSKLGTWRFAAAEVNAGAIGHIMTVKELIDSIISGAEKILDSCEFLKTR